MLSKLAVRALDVGIVEGRVHDRGPEIIKNDPAGHAPEELEGGAV